MKYNIGEVSEITNLSTSTLRYYDKIGLFKDLERTKGGVRIFDDYSLDIINLIECLKKSGLCLNDILNYINLVELGNESLKERKQIFDKQLVSIEQEILNLEITKATLTFKQWYYEESLSQGVEFDYSDYRIADFPIHIQQLINSGYLPHIKKKINLERK